MMKVKVIFDKVACVGNKICLTTQSDTIQELGPKVHLKDAQPQDGKWVLEAELSDNEIEKVKKAAELCPKNAIEIIDVETGETLVKTKVTQQENVKTVIAQYDDEKEFVLDPNGYFLIKNLPDTKEIEIAFCDKPNSIKVIVKGSTPVDIYMTVLNKLGKQLISRFDHAAYLGRELQKAHTCLRLGIPYVQDDELDLARFTKE